MPASWMVCCVSPSPQPCLLCRLLCCKTTTATSDGLPASDRRENAIVLDTAAAARSHLCSTSTSSSSRCCRCCPLRYRPSPLRRHAGVASSSPVARARARKGKQAPRVLHRSSKAKSKYRSATLQAINTAHLRSHPSQSRTRILTLPSSLSPISLPHCKSPTLDTPATVPTLLLLPGILDCLSRARPS